MDGYPELSWRPAGSSTGDVGFDIEADIDGGSRLTHAGDGRPRVRWPFSELPSRSTVRWRVREEHGDWSAWATFRTGLLRAEDWSAAWISPLDTDEHRSGSERGAFLLRGIFQLDGAAEEAVLYATALGVYEASINGVRVGDLELTPGASTYDRTLYAQAYDVTPLVRPGVNTIDVTVSDGWYRGHNGGAQLRDVWGDQLAVLAQLEVEVGGDALRVVTGEDWTTLTSPIVSADLMRGQSTDLRIDPDRSEPSPVLVGRVAPPTPVWSPAPPVRRVEERRPVSLTTLAPGISILDVGQNLSGWLRLADLGPIGAGTVLEFAEHLAPDGDITTDHLSMTTPMGERMVTEQTDVVVSAGDGGSFEPRHTVHGFRYVRVTHPGRTLGADAFTVVVVHSDLEPVSEFACDVPALNRLHDAARWSFRGNIVDVPTDCPTRERMGWTGDFQVFAPVATELYDIDGFTTKWLRSVRDDQLYSGVPAAFSPDPGRARLHPDDPQSVLGGSAGWGDAAVMVPWTLYRAYGDIAALASSWESMTAWVDYVLRCARDLRHPDRVARHQTRAEHEQFIWDGPFHFGEWLEPKTRSADGTLIDPMADMRTYMGLDRGEVGTAYLFRTLRTITAAARLLGRLAEGDQYAVLSESVRDAWQTEFLRSDGRTEADTQSAYVQALAFDLVPPQLRSLAAARLAELIRDNGDRLSTGFLSSGMLLPVLAGTGHIDLASRVLLQTESPSWLNMLERGATTMWEDWDGITPDGSAHESLNHYSKGAVIGFLHQYLAGLRQDESSSGWERFTVAPFPGGGVRRVDYQYQSPKGRIAVAWAHEGERFILRVTVPGTATAHATLPDGSTHLLQGGQHTLTALLRDPIGP